MHVLRKIFFNYRDVPVFIFSLSDCSDICENMTLKASVRKLVVKFLLFYSEHFCRRGIG